ncbi:hypothetical protein [Pseudomonas sp. R3-52-08]|uniref:hypothetical protein n=1 Tax=Pseudomonas sp. R3-52-08 TaxID=1173284 RepID=UPI000F568330|nr:hypothetical protein [Pseudomonas sp. R3-52-08]AZF21729.1 hypothetical protein C4J91_2980 [Pseudomonas sp. R3-52-08]
MRTFGLSTFTFKTSGYGEEKDVAALHTGKSVPQMIACPWGIEQKRTVFPSFSEFNFLQLVDK